ncbi:MAG TPA: TIGR02996 domain-containing protein, partial [Streptosporangiaceae bacterium]
QLEAARQHPPAGFLEDWSRARTDFEAAEEQWNHAYRAGIVVVVNDQEADAAEERPDSRYEQVLASPLDDAPRLAYADAVESLDQERAEFIRLQVRLARLRRERNKSAPPGPYLRELALITERGAEWAADVAGLAEKWQYLRGFVDVAWMDAAAFLATAAELYRRAPVLHLNLTAVAPVADELFASPHLRRIRSISMVAERLGDDAAIALAASPHLAELEWLDLRNNQIGQQGLEALAASQLLPRLGFLGFSGNAAEDPTPRHADEYDADTLEATDLQSRYGPRDWLSARERAVWPPDRDAVW